MGQTVSGTFVMQGSAINFDIGFIPDEVEVIYNLEEGDNEVIHKWFRALADLGDKGVYTEGRYGISISAAGAVTIPTTADTGIIPYLGAETPRVRIVSPDGDGFQQALVYGDWSAAVDYNSVGTDRSTTAIGTIVRPPIHNGKVFELITKTGSGTSEPTTWDVAPGETVTDGGSNVWICREEDIVRAAGLGFTIGTTMSTDSDQGVFVARKHLRTGDLGNADSPDPLTFN